MTNELTSLLFVGNSELRNIPLSIRLIWRRSYRKRSKVHNRTFRKTPDCVRRGHTTLAPLLLIYVFPRTVLVLSLLSQTFFAQIPFFIRSIFALHCPIFIVFFVGTRNLMH